MWLLEGFILWLQHDARPPSSSLKLHLIGRLNPSDKITVRRICGHRSRRRSAASESISCVSSLTQWTLTGRRCREMWSSSFCLFLSFFPLPHCLLCDICFCGDLPSLTWHWCYRPDSFRLFQLRFRRSRRRSGHTSVHPSHTLLYCVWTEILMSLHLNYNMMVQALILLVHTEIKSCVKFRGEFYLNTHRFISTDLFNARWVSVGGARLFLLSLTESLCWVWSLYFIFNWIYLNPQTSFSAAETNTSLVQCHQEPCGRLPASGHI